MAGADGPHSATRRLVMGEAPLSHLGAYISILSTPNLLGKEQVIDKFLAPMYEAANAVELRLPTRL